MSDEERAYEAALKLINKAIADKWTKVYFNGTEFRNLKKIPQEIAKIEGLTLIDLDSTNIADLSPLTESKHLSYVSANGTEIEDLNSLSEIHKLEFLYLNNTRVSSLAPISQLEHLQHLTLNDTDVEEVRDLKSLSNLKSLYLAKTKVSDISSLSDLKELKNLRLDNSDTRDLRPLLGLEGLITKHRPGLTFHSTPATALDATLALLAQIEDPKDRAEQTLAYLHSLPPWPEPYTPRDTPDGSPPQPIGAMPKLPEQDPALPLIWGENGFTFFADSIDSDPVTESALDELRARLEDLRRKGNRHDDLYRIAGELQDRSNGPIPALNMVKLHLSYQKLRRLHAGRATRQDGFDDETVTTIAAVLDVVPGVTLADNGVRILIERQEAERNAGLSDAQSEAAKRVLEDVQEPDAPFAPEVKEVAAEVLKPGTEDRLAATRGTLSRNVVISALTYFGAFVVDGAVSGPVGSFVYDHGPDLLAYAATMGDDALIWAQSVMAKFRVEYELAMGIARDLSGGTLPPKHKSPRTRGGF